MVNTPYTPEDKAYKLGDVLRPNAVVFLGVGDDYSDDRRASWLPRHLPHLPPLLQRLHQVTRPSPAPFFYIAGVTAQGHYFFFILFLDFSSCSSHFCSRSCFSNHYCYFTMSGSLQLDSWRQAGKAAADWRVRSLATLNVFQTIIAFHARVRHVRNIASDSKQ